MNIDELHPFVQAFIKEPLRDVVTVSGRLPYKVLHELRVVFLDAAHMLLDVEAERRAAGDPGEEPGKIQIVKPGMI